MNKMSVTKRFKFAAAHQLHNHQGKCRFLHGHEWLLDVTVSGQINKQSGMIVDFNHLKGIIEQEFINRLDHTFLNDTFPTPTAELILAYLATNIPPHLVLMGVELEKLELWESSDSKATWEK
jgi:6-pyruvoyltetrahydropterin/6-carboxytetrahydropterin synthase